MRAATIAFPALVQPFFQRRLVAERRVSAHTVASYRDTFELLLRYAEHQTGRAPSALTLDDLTAPVVLAFLDHLESARGNTPRTRNLRLTAIRSLMRYAAVREPTALPVAQAVLAIATKRVDHPVLTFLSREEVQAVLDAPERTTWSGQRDAVLLRVLYNTGVRVSEMTGLRLADVCLGASTGTGVARAAVWTARRRRYSTPERDRRCPARLGKTGALRCGLATKIQPLPTSTLNPTSP